MEKISKSKVRVNRKEESFHNVKNVHFENDVMFLNIDNSIYEFNLKDVSKKLYKANKKEREAYKVICSGYGIQWPLIDEDLSIDGLINSHKQKVKKR